MIRLAPVDKAYIHQTWPLVKDYVESAFTTDCDTPREYSVYSMDNVLQYITTGQWTLLVFLNDDDKIVGATTVEFQVYPLHTVALVTSIGGHLIINRDTVEQYKMYCKHRGATMIQAYGRKSIVRLWQRYKFEPRTTLVELLL